MQKQLLRSTNSMIEYKSAIEIQAEIACLIHRVRKKIDKLISQELSIGKYYNATYGSDMFVVDKITIIKGYDRPNMAVQFPFIIKIDDFMNLSVRKSDGVAYLAMERLWKHLENIEFKLEDKKKQNKIEKDRIKLTKYLNS